MTQVNTIAGTPLFMAPECVTRTSEIDARTDIYALGGVGYYLITGVPPFGGRTVVEICGHHLHTPPTPPSEKLGRPVPSLLEALLLRCLAKDPAARPGDAELLALLRECQRESPFSHA